jgi:FMN-dependent NADH-azoreductase
MVSASPTSARPLERDGINTILYLTSSPRGGNSFSNKIGTQALQELQRAHPTADFVVRDLAREVLPHIDEDFAAGMAQPVEAWSPAQNTAITRSDILIEELLRADIIVIAVPMINFTIPSTLKVWVDHVTRRGRTFVYGENGPQGLVTGKQVILVQGGVYSGSMQPYDFVTPYLKHMLGFLGMTDMHVIDIEGMTRGADLAERSLARGMKCTEAVVKEIAAPDEVRVSTGRADYNLMVERV